MLDDYAGAVPAELVAVEVALHAYRRWGQDDTAALTWRTTCNSAERLYRPHGWEALEERREPDALELTDFAAMKIDAAIRALPGIERDVVKALYLKPDSVGGLRRLGIQPCQAQRAHLAGLRRLAAKLTEVFDA